MRLPWQLMMWIGLLILVQGCRRETVAEVSSDQRLDTPITSLEARKLRLEPRDESIALIGRSDAAGSLEIAIDYLGVFAISFLDSMTTAGERDAYVELLLTGKSPREVIVMGFTLHVAVLEKYKASGHSVSPREAARRKIETGFEQLNDMERVDDYWKPSIVHLNRDGRPQPLTESESALYAARCFNSYSNHHHVPAFDSNDPLVSVSGDVIQYDWNSKREESKRVRIFVTSAGKVTLLAGSDIPHH